MLATYTDRPPSFLGLTGDVLRAHDTVDPDEEAFERFEDDGGPCPAEED